MPSMLTPPDGMTPDKAFQALTEFGVTKADATKAAWIADGFLSGATRDVSAPERVLALALGIIYGALSYSEESFDG